MIRIATLACVCASLLACPSSRAQDHRPTTIVYGSWQCDYCKMLFEDKAYGGELEFNGDSMLVFDATECIAAYLISKKIPEDRIRKVWSIDFCRPGELIDGKLAFYVQSDRMSSPMGVNVAACATERQADSLVARHGGTKLDWYGVQRLVKQKWYPETLPQEKSTKKKSTPKNPAKPSPGSDRVAPKT